jgi:Xaa-Pro aminopeptidase
MTGMTNKELFILNRQKLYNKIKDNSLTIVFSADTYPRNGNQPFKYRQNSDLFYYSGINQEKTIILLHKASENNTVSEYAFIVEPNEEMLIWTGYKLLPEDAREISGIDNIKYLKDFNSIYEELILCVDTVYYSFSNNILSNKTKNLNSEEWIKKYKLKFSDKEYLDLDELSHKLRLQKSEAEIAIIQKACNITEQAFRAVLKTLKSEMREYEIEAEITKVCTSLGSEGFSYLPIIASGVNNCILHYSTNRGICKDGDLLLMDFGAEYNNYASDLSRTIPVSGKFTERQKKVYNAVLRVQKQIKQKYVLDYSLPTLNEECSKLIEEELLTLGLITKNDINNQNPSNPAYKRYYMHNVSHYMGLDVHDVGDRTINLLPGMVMSCEPGIYIAEEGFGIRLENDILVTENQPIDLFKNIPIEVDEIEELMNL